MFRAFVNEGPGAPPAPGGATGQRRPAPQAARSGPRTGLIVGVLVLVVVVVGAVWLALS